MNLNYRHIAAQKTKELNDKEEGEVVFFRRYLNIREKELLCDFSELAAEFFRLEFEMNCQNLDWHELKESRALELVQHVLSYRVYGSKSLFERSAKQIAKGFICEFEGDRKFYTSGIYNDDFTMCTGKSVFGAIEDGIVVHDHQSIGILWVKDED